MPSGVGKWSITYVNKENVNSAKNDISFHPREERNVKIKFFASYKWEMKNV